MSTESRLLDVVIALSCQRDMGGVREVVREAARELTGADGVTIVLKEGDLCHYVDEDAISPLWKGRRFPIRACISGWCMTHRARVAIADIYEDERVPHDAYRPTFVKSLAMAPIRGADPIGAIGAYWAERHEPTAEELDTLQTLGDAAAMAISNVQLIGALSEAEHRTERFLTMLAHELRNPLAPIRNGLHLLRRGGDAERVRSAGEMVERQLRHLTRIVDDLLDVSRLVRDQVTLDRTRLDLGGLVRDAVEDRRGGLEEAGLSVRLDVPEEPVWVMGDEVRLAQVLGNLLDNARKFTPSGGGVSVRLTTDDAASAATVEVRDTGSGIDPALLPHVFDVLAQEDASLERAPGGLGLGLSVARSLTELHGGSIDVDSPGPGKGTVARVHLPRQPELPAVDGEAGAEPRGGAPGSARVLVVEDNLDAATSLRMILEAWGYEVRVAHAGPEGVEQARVSLPQVVLCDIGLPGMDGYAVAQELRRDPSTRAARLIAITGYGGDEHRSRALSAGFDVHMVKPVKPEALRETLRAG